METKTVTLEHVHKDLESIQTQLHLIQNILSEEYELTDEAKQQLEEARSTPRSEYISNEDVKKELGL